MGDFSTFARIKKNGIGAGSNGSKVAALDGRHDLTDQTPLLGLEMFEELQSDMAKISEESKSGMDEIRSQIADTQQNVEIIAKNSEESKAEMIEMRQLIESLSRESSSSHDAFLKDVL